MINCQHMRKKTSNTNFVFTLCIILISWSLQAQNINDYFQKIRKNEAELTAFISQMPKGGDLHNHYSGAVYGESYVRWLINADYFVNPQTLETVSPSDKRSSLSGFSRFSALKSTMSDAAFDILRSNLIRLWSTKEYDQVHTDPREEHFFATFGNFSAASGLNFDSGLMELKQRARAENVSYIETMLVNIRCNKPDLPVAIFSNADTIKYYNSLLIRLEAQNNLAGLKPVLQYLYSVVMEKLPVMKTAASANSWVDGLHKNST